jgi:hypothetical protein
MASEEPPPAPSKLVFAADSIAFEYHSIQISIDE